MSDEPDDDELEDLAEEESKGDVSLRPNENADDHALVERLVPAKIREKYEIISYRNAAVILSQARNEEFADILRALEEFTLTTQMIRTAGGNESDHPERVLEGAASPWLARDRHQRRP